MAMSAKPPRGVKGTCFVVMGFGKKTDFESGRTFDLDKSYRHIIKPAVEAAGLNCVRADEIVHSGLIDMPMYEQLLNADVVVADLSTSNKNAFYELGVRHALRPFTTVVIAEDGIKSFPFDVNHVAVRQYHHLGEDIGYEEAMRFRKLLTQAIKEITEKDPRPKDSPVYTLLHELTPPALAAVQVAVQAVMASTGDPDGATEADAASTEGEGDAQGRSAMALTHSMLMQQVDEAQARDDFATARSLMSVIRHLIKAEAPSRPEDPFIIQRLALMTYKSERPSKEASLIEARDLLASLNPETSNDTETLGLWGSVHKHLWEITKDPMDLDRAVRACERGFYLRNDYYNGINFAYLLNLRAANTPDPAEAIADFVQARRVRKEVLSICEEWLAKPEVSGSYSTKEEAKAEYLRILYWVLATMGEAYFGLGDELAAQEALERAYSLAPKKWMEKTKREQIRKLRQLLEKSPLRYIKTDATP
jgi:tetratricopeptide (TPR) repeat protein